MTGLREAIAKALIPWLAHDRRKRMQATDAVLRVLAEHGDTEQVREGVSRALSQTAAENGFALSDLLLERFLNAVMTVVAPIVAELTDARADISDLKGWVTKEQRRADRAEADLAAARQQLEALRRHRSITEGIDAPARPAGHDETGQ